MDTAPPQWWLDELRLAFPRGRLRYVHWEAAPNDESGDDCWSPFGPPTIRATNGLGDVGIRFMWGGEGWMKLNPDAVTKGRWMLLEEVEGQECRVADLCGVDTSFQPFDQRMLSAIRQKVGDIEFVKRKRKEEQDAQSEHEIETAEGRAIVRRNPDGRSARDESEQQVKELESYRWMRNHGEYQFNPPAEPKGIKHPAGFTIIDRRVSAQSSP